MYRGRFIPDEVDASDRGEAVASHRDVAQVTPARSDSAPLRTRRIACLLVGDFPAAAIIRANPEMRERPFAIIPMPAGKRATPASANANAVVQQVSPHARAAGVRPGMTVANARTLVPDLAIIYPSPTAERAAADALADTAESMSPIVEEGEPGCVWLDLTGTGRVHGLRAARDSGNSSDTVDDATAPDAAVETAIAEELMRRTRLIGLEAAAGIAAGKEIARLAARCGGARVIPHGMEREFLDWMPLDLIGPGVDAQGRDLEHTLKRLGIQRLGKIAQLDIRAVGTRLGARGVELARLARGEDTATIVARPRAAIFTEALELEYGIEQLEALGFILRGMLTNLTVRLGMRGFAAGDMTLSLGLSDHRRDERRVAVAAPTLEPRALLTLLLLSLEASAPPAAIETIRLTLEACPPRAAQSDLFRPPTPAPDRLETTLARIAALCGPDRVGMLAAANSYRPEAVRRTAFAPPPVTDAAPDAARKSAANGIARIMLRTIRPPMEVEVMCAGMAPEFVRGASVSARVVSAAGPWRRQGEWWTGDFASAHETSAPDGAGSHHASWQAAAPAAYLRDYYELALAEAGVYRVYRDLQSGKWYVDGIYD